VSLNDIRPKPSDQTCQIEDPGRVQPQPRDLGARSHPRYRHFVLDAQRSGTSQKCYVLPQAKIGQRIHKVGSEQLSTSPLTGRDDVQEAKRRSSRSDQ
jgi:hypothetical protein